jgi:predicted Rossmann fold nucleotide-binding protein DprA/Smf involved in DNA uptake
VVVEAGEGSGALHTANAARVQKKRVFAVPGSMFSSSSLGNQELLRAGALVAASADDIVAALDGVAQVTRKQPRLPPQSPVASRPGFKTRKSASSAPPSNTALPVPSCKPVVSTDPLLSLWQTEEACGLDALVARAVARNLWPIDRAGAALLEALLLLEMQGLVQRLPGPTYRRV